MNVMPGECLLPRENPEDGLDVQLTFSNRVY